MALFSRKPKAEKAVVAKAPKVAKTPAAKASAPVLSAATSVLVRPHITEKSGLLANQGVYTFEVVKDATADKVAKAVAAAYKVTPIRVSTVPMKSKVMFVRGKRGKTVSGKKAYVYLKEGDKIEFI
ncbi:MAG: 50S ribosomal protein L23 [Candidatus Paceibacterota bacterium]|jgi:large subunit ribosomal protein L23